jgi:hypothetical protein
MDHTRVLVLESRYRVGGACTIELSRLTSQWLQQSGISRRHLQAVASPLEAIDVSNANEVKHSRRGVKR